MDWIEQVKPIFQEVSLETGIKLGHDTHYDARNFVYSIIRGNEIHRLDFQPMDNGAIQITKYIDKYPIFPVLLKQINNWIPFAPLLAVVQYTVLGEIAHPLEQASLKKQVLGMVKNAL